MRLKARLWCLFSIVAVPCFLGVASCVSVGDNLDISEGGDFLSGITGRVGTLMTSAGDTCVATLVDDAVVLTAAHCLYDARGRKFSPRDLTFHRASRESIRAIATELHPNFDHRVGETIAAIAADVAFVRLAQSAGIFGQIRVGGLVYQDDRVIVGQKGGRVAQDCRVLATTGSLFTLDCKVSLGDSGAPVFREHGSGRYEVVGVVSAFETEGNARTAIATEIDIDFNAI